MIRIVLDVVGAAEAICASFNNLSDLHMEALSVQLLESEALDNGNPDH